MNKPSKFVSILNEDQVSELNETRNSSNNRRLRQRAHAIILSSKGYNIDEIAKIIESDRDRISYWFDRWEEMGLEGLKEKARSGNPGILNESEKQLVIELCKENPRSITTIIAILFEKTGKRVSDSTITRLLKKAGLCWKRIQKTMKNERDASDFSAAKTEIQELKKNIKNLRLNYGFLMNQDLICNRVFLMLGNRLVKQSKSFQNIVSVLTF